MSEYIQAYEYESNVNPLLNNVPIITKNVKDCNLGINCIDNGSVYRVSYKATSPNLLASFIILDEHKDGNEAHQLQFDASNGILDTEINAASHLFYVLQGKCRFTFSEQVYTRGEEYGETYIDTIYKEFMVESGEIFICPTFLALKITNILENEKTEIYYVNDSPLLNYLGAEAQNKVFQPCVYNNAFLQEKLQQLSDPKKNRKGILLSNNDTERIGINTITPTLWALYNELPPNTAQRPHKHNSVALDLCIGCSDSENVYTLMGDTLDEEGNIVNPTKVHWKQGVMFTTPPGLWHSHHNNGITYAYVLPIQDAGLLLYQRILGIVLK